MYFILFFFVCVCVGGGGGGGERRGVCCWLSDSYPVPVCYHPILLDNNNPYPTPDMLFSANLITTVVTR